MSPILRSVVAQVSRGGRSVLSHRNFSSEPCRRCGGTGIEGETASSVYMGRYIAEALGISAGIATVYAGAIAFYRFPWK